MSSDAKSDVPNSAASVEMLVYVDPSQRGEWALRAAAHLVPAVFENVALLATKEDVEAEPGLVARARKAFDGAGSGPASSAAMLREIVSPGPAERAVVGAARAKRYALIVVPPAGRRALARLVKGSRVATVVRSVGASVLVARRPPDAFRRILLAVGGGVHSVTTALGAAEVARALGASLDVMHVDSSVELSPEMPWTERRASDPAAAARTTRDETLDGVRAALAGHGYANPLRLRRGMIVSEVLAEIEENACDLLVLGAHRAAGAERWMLDDVTEQILLQSPVSILVIRPPEP